MPKSAAGFLVLQLPEKFQSWFSSRGWQVRQHQLDMLDVDVKGKCALLIAPTGAGKTLAGFLPTLVAFHKNETGGTAIVTPAATAGVSRLKTLYISPLKALATDVARNLEIPVQEMGLGLRIESRTGDTPAAKRSRQRENPPDILLTTPEQLALLTSHPQARAMFSGLQRVIIDELHALATNKRGEMLALDLMRLFRLAPGLKTVGLSATVANPKALSAFLAPDGQGVEIIEVKEGIAPQIEILEAEGRIPWSGHSSRHAYAQVYKAIAAKKTTIIFVNTRSQAEMLFQALWQMNDENLPIALHHGSLDKTQRRKVESAMAAGKLRAIVATSTLDLGIDWGDIDLVIHVGAPKGASRLTQRIGRANHRLDEASEALLVPANRFEVMECVAARDATLAGEQDTEDMRDGGLDVLAQHIMGMACSEPFHPVDLYEEITSAAHYRNLSFATFEKVIEMVATGGYALKNYEQYARLKQLKDGRWAVTSPRVRQQHRMNIGTIVEFPTLDVRFGKRVGGTAKFRGTGTRLGSVEEGFLEMLSPGDTFLFAGRILRLEGVDETTAYVSAAETSTPKIPSYAGGKLPLSSHLAARVRTMLANPSSWNGLSEQTRDWLKEQQKQSLLPDRDGLLVETFPFHDRFFLIAYPFEGRNAHQSLGMLLTRRLERARAQPLGFVATEYALSVWGRKDWGAMIEAGTLNLDALFHPDMLGDDLEAWLDESVLMQRHFSNCAQIAGLVQRRYPGMEKTGRAATISAGLIYDVLRRYEPDHILLQAARQDAAKGYLDIKRLSDMLNRSENHITHKALSRVSPLAVPVMLEIGREPIYGEAQEAILMDEADQLYEEACGAR